MIAHDADDPMLQQLSRLRPLSPDPARAERVRTQCRAQLVCTRRSERAAAIAAFARASLGPALIGSVCVLYLVELVDAVLGLRSLID
jgi:hypothetical protein